MGFYGNITNTSKTTFNFDVTYSSRYEMEQKSSTDGVYLGRYALVEYSTGCSEDTFFNAYVMDSMATRFYTSYDEATRTQIKYGAERNDTTVRMGDIVRAEPNEKNGFTATRFYECIGGDRYNIAQFKMLVDSDNRYTQNFNIDRAKYGDGKGYDSTVWVKASVVENGLQRVKYVQIAELNSVVPTFDICADAPTQTPIAPHFDTSSTNVYYKVHWQPNWGFRIKREDDHRYSDEKIVHTKQIYHKTGTYDTVETLYLEKKHPFLYDEKGEVILDENDQPTYNESEWIYEWIVPQIPVGGTEPAIPELDGAIFYNEQGFYPWVKTEINEIDNEITMTPGKSGNLYNSHNGEAPKEADDTYELSIRLPIIGNTVSKMWDMIYNDPGNGMTRNTDINWDSTAGVRMISPTYIEDAVTGKPITGAMGWNQYNVQSMAGCINSVHDLMGMIVDTMPSLGDTANAALDRIYYNRADGKFYIKYLKYNYKNLVEPDPATGRVDYSDIDLEEVVERYKQIDLTQFAPNTYFYKSGQNYYLDANDTPSRGNKYVSIEAKRELLSDDYTPNSYYYRKFTDADVAQIAKVRDDKIKDYEQAYADGKMSIDTYNAAVQKAHDDYWASYWAFDQAFYVDSNELPSRGREYYYVHPKQIANAMVMFYEPNKYFYTLKDEPVDPEAPPEDEPENELDKYTIATETAEEFKQNYEQLIEVRKYYRIEQEGTKLETQPDGMGGYHQVEVPVYVAYEVTLIPFEENKYYFWNMTENIFTLQNTIIPKALYYELEVEARHGFYEANMYHYKDGNNYILDTDLIREDPTREYFTLTVTEVPNTFYEPHIYYFYNDIGKKYVLDIEKNMTEGRVYYEKNSLYVAHDVAAVFADGAVWNDYANNVPDTVCLATRSEYYDWKELEGFGRDLNTIHGLIIEINRLLQMQDYQTRELNTVQGCINQVKDILNTFELLKPGNFVIIDEYGRFSNTGWDSKQDFSTTNEQVTHPENNAQTDGDGRWIKVSMDYNAIAPNIKFTHEFTPVENTSTFSDKNIPLDDESSGNNDDTDDEVVLYTPIVDNKGHVVGKNEETVTLPYGFKYFSAENSTEEGKWSQGEGVTASANESVKRIVADSTKDAFKFKAGNKWVRFQTDANTGNDTNKETSPDGNNILTLAHETHDIDVAAAADSDINSNGDSITIQDIDFDAAGHVTKNKKHKYTLPFGFKKITTNGRGTGTAENATGTPETEEVIADNTQDTLAVNSGNKWVRIDSDNDANKIIISHDIHTLTTTDKADSDLNDGEDTLTIQDIEFDGAGHMTKNQKHKYTLPFGFKKVVTNGRGTSDTENATGNPVKDEVVADNTQDTLRVDSGNPWVRIDTDETKNAIVISHDIHSPTTTAKADSDINNNGDKITIQDIEFDKAGHMTKNQAHSYILPYGFKKFTGANSNAVTAPTTVASDTLIATTTQDTLNVSMMNKWLKVDTATAKGLKLGHILSGVTAGSYGQAENKDVEGLDVDNTFSIPYITVDEAGHITAASTKTIVVPENYKKISVGAVSSAATNAADGLAGSVIADKLEDELTLYPGNKWIRIAANRAGSNTSADDAITFGHILSGATAGSYGDGNAQTPNFSGTFKVPFLTIDEAGHITAISEHTVTIPKASLSDMKKSSSDVIVQLSLTDTTGAFSTTRANVGTLTLTGFSAGETGRVAASDSINVAFSKVDGRLNTLENKSLVETSTKFSYTYNGTTSEKTIAQLCEYIASLEGQIAELKGRVDSLDTPPSA